jgi:gamma-butyrobetaine dioxygenase
MLTFDNRRVLHGRTAFDPNSGPRHLQGTYLDRDLVLSRLRVLDRAAGAEPTS